MVNLGVFRGYYRVGWVGLFIVCEYCQIKDDWELKVQTLGMGSNGIGYLSKELLEGFDSKQKKYLRKMINDELVIIDSKSQDEMFELACFKEAVNWKENLRQKSSEVSSSLRRG